MCNADQKGGIYAPRHRRYNKGVTHIREYGTKTGEDPNNQTPTKKEEKERREHETGEDRQVRRKTREKTPRGRGQLSPPARLHRCMLVWPSPIQSSDVRERKEGMGLKDQRTCKALLVRVAASRAAEINEERLRQRGGRLVRRKRFPECNVYSCPSSSASSFPPPFSAQPRAPAPTPAAASPPRTFRAATAATTRSEEKM